jgi:ABC-type uncharacterized transport system permease subunit
LRVFGFGDASKIAQVATAPLIFAGLKIALAVSFGIVVIGILGLISSVLFQEIERKVIPWKAD